MKILVIQPKMIGDVLTSTILLEMLRHHYPKAELHYLVNKNTLPVLENNPFIDQTIAADTFSGTQKDQIVQLYTSLKSHNYSIIIDVYSKISTALLGRFLGVDQRIGYHKSYTAFLYTHSVKRHHSPKHKASLAIENRLKLLKPLGIGFKAIRPKIYLTANELSTAKNILTKGKIDFDKPLIMVSILGSSSDKTYPKDFMVELLNYCHDQDQRAQFFFNYIPKQREEALAIYNQLQSKTQKMVYFNIFGKSLREFLALMNYCNAAIGNEGGAINMAKALDIPTFSIFSPALPKQNWFGKAESQHDRAVHLSDFIVYKEGDQNAAKKNTQIYYQKLKPALIKPSLKQFMASLPQDAL